MPSQADVETPPTTRATDTMTFILWLILAALAWPLALLALIVNRSSGSCPSRSASSASP
jgi:hypothetical protein